MNYRNSRFYDSIQEHHFIKSRACFCLCLFLVHLFFGHFFFNPQSQVIFRFEDYVHHSIPQISYIVFLISLLVGAIGFWARLSLTISSLAYFLYIRWPMDALLWHDQNIVFWTLLLFALFSSNTSNPLQAWKSKKNIQTSFYFYTHLLLPLFFFSSAMAKLLDSGLLWFDGNTLKVIFIEYAILAGGQWGLTLASFDGLMMVLSLGFFIYQLSFPLTLINLKMRLLGGLSALVFFATLYAITRINFFNYMLPYFLVYIPWSTLRSHSKKEAN